jgi:hypothetical protein
MSVNSNVRPSTVPAFLYYAEGSLLRTNVRAPSSGNILAFQATRSRDLCYTRFKATLSSDWLTGFNFI